MLQSIRTVLVEISHAGNTGSVARTMKTMGLANLWPVSPLIKPDSQAIVLAAGAGDVIGSAQIVDILDEALAGCNLVIGTSTRSRTPPWPMLDPRGYGLKNVSKAMNSPVALAPGRERAGLTNEELQKCHYHVAIAASPEYSSLNLTVAVQVISYEARMAWPATQESDKTVDYEGAEYPLVDDLGRFYGHLKQTPLSARLIRGGHPGQAVNKLRHLFIRVRSESQGLNTLYGILASVEQQNKSK